MKSNLQGWMGRCALAALLVLPLAGSASAAQLTRDQVAQIASACCKRLGVSNEPPLYITPPNGRNRWEVRSNDAAVTVDDATRQVRAFVDDTVRRRLSRTPPSPAVPAAQAVAAAEAEIEAVAGFPPDLGAPTIVEDTGSSAAAHDLRINWPRLFHGLPCPGQFVTATVQAETGQVIGFGISADRPQPALVPFEVPAAQAAAIAERETARRWNRTDLALSMLREAVVQPTTTGGLVDSGPPMGPARLAWQCIYLGPAGQRYEFWLDARTGAILGADRWGTLAAQPPPHRGLLPSGIARPLQIKIYARDPKHGWSKDPEVVLTPENDKVVIQALNDSPVAETEFVANPRWKLRALGRGQVDLRTVYYVPDKGLIGAPGDWYQAPEILKARLDKAGKTTIHKVNETASHKASKTGVHK